ncbi:MAG: NAD-dependent epimerase/dehydratase family protein [Desulfomonile tiedjei]|nr:NAD-dependent epimerase/dehydratase family protein [Desulfomonile tiedjei]
MTLSDASENVFPHRPSPPQGADAAALVAAFRTDLDRLTRNLVRQLRLERNVLVVGGAGYIGSVLVRKLLATGCKVTVLDDLIYDNGSSIAALLDLPEFSFVRGDLCHGETLHQALAGVTDVVLLAALVGDPLCKKYPDLARRVNHDGAKTMIDRLNGRGIDRFVFLSTCSNYGLRQDDTYATEEAELNPKSLYAETKVAVEQHIIGNAAGCDFCPTILRAATAYGVSDRMRFDLTVSEFARTLAIGEELLVYDEHTWRPYCHVDDISSAIITVLDTPRPRVCGEIFNVGSTDENYTKKMIVDALLPHAPGAVVKYKEGGFDPRNYRVSFEKIASKLGFTHKHSVNTCAPALMNNIRSGFFGDVGARRWFYGNYEVRNM